MTSTATTPGPVSHAPSPATDAMQAALRPVASAMMDDARHTARTLTENAESHAHEVLTAARAEVDAVRRDARAEGERAASRAAAADLAAARSEARALILAAHRRAYEALRDGALEELTRRRDSVEVQALAVALATLATGRVGRHAVVHRTGPAGLDVVAELGSRRAVVSAAALVDHQLAAMAEEVERLWS